MRKEYSDIVDNGPSKEEQSQKLAEDIQRFLDGGGEIQYVPAGETALVLNLKEQHAFIIQSQGSFQKHGDRFNKEED